MWKQFSAIHRPFLSFFTLANASCVCVSSYPCILFLFLPENTFFLFFCLPLSGDYGEHICLALPWELGHWPYDTKQAQGWGGEGVGLVAVCRSVSCLPTGGTVVMENHLSSVRTKVNFGFHRVGVRRGGDKALNFVLHRTL